MKVRILKESQQTPLVVAYFGGFKPPHKGHNAVVDEYLGQRGADKVLILFGPTPRHSDDGSVSIDGEKSRQAWELFTEEYPSDRVEIMVVESGSPMLAAAKLAWDDRFAGHRLSPGYSEKDPKYGDLFLRTIKGLAKELGKPKATLVLVPSKTNLPDISATNIRNAIASDDIQTITNSIPDDVNPSDYLSIMKEWREYLLTELFDTSDAYDFKLKKKDEEHDYAGAEYRFVAQKNSR